MHRRRTRYDVTKRAVDLLVCLVAIPLLAPLALLCATAIKASSPGPVLFRQHRAGRGGKPFKMIKFRTMVVEAEAVKAALRAENGFKGPDFKLLRDPRITPIGRFLRRTSLDELPQVWNILVGDMTLVGPRPTSFGVDVYTPWHQERLEVTPGLTGLWQIKARGDTNFDERVRLDVAYVRGRSLWLDFSILAKTLPSVLLQRGAH
ncbi:MAG: sugar transferase [Pseudomonadota bacterium]